MKNKATMSYNEFCQTVCEIIHLRYGEVTSKSQLEDALGDEPFDMYQDGCAPDEYVDQADGEYGKTFWIPEEL